MLSLRLFALYRRKKVVVWLLYIGLVVSYSLSFVLANLSLSILSRMWTFTHTYFDLTSQLSAYRIQSRLQKLRGHARDAFSTSFLWGNSWVRVYVICAYYVSCLGGLSVSNGSDYRSSAAGHVSRYAVVLSWYLRSHSPQMALFILLWCSALAFGISLS